MHIKNFKALGLGLLSALTVPVDAYWRMSCPGTLVMERLDPVVAPGKVSGHAHIIFGGNGFAPTMDYDSTQASTCTSCGISADKSNYWIPTMYYQAQNGSFISVDVVGGGGGTVYYEQRTTYPGKTLQAFPEGFRMTAGNPELRTYNDTEAQQAITYVCLDYAGGGPPQSNTFPTVNCPDGIRTQVYFPACSNGSLDSTDHQSHMAYPIQNDDSGTCPDSHPQPVISIFYEVIWDTGKFANDWYGSGQPFVLSMGDNTGYGLHGDFVNGWDVSVLQNAVTNCNDPGGNVSACEYFTQVSDEVAGGCILPAIVNETITGVLESLPGCNPVSANPAPASSCPDSPALLSQAQLEAEVYTNLIDSKGWYYVGCGTDNYFDRAFPGNSESLSTMTIELCVDYCIGQGHTIAGLEYAQECYCGDSIPSSAAPVPGVVGKCNYACAGDSSEWCGGYGTLSIYEKCGSTCQNAEFGPSLPGASGSPSTTSTLVAKTKPTVSSATTPTTSTSTSAAAPSATPSSNVTLPSGWEAAGCYSDNLNPRSLSAWGYYGEPVTSSGCVNYCNTENYSFAGTEYAGQCFCGNELTQSQLEPSTDCNMACQGDADEICGGSARLSVFTKSTSSKMKRSHKHRKRVHHFAASS